MSENNPTYKPEEVEEIKRRALPLIVEVLNDMMGSVSDFAADPFAPVDIADEVMRRIHPDDDDDDVDDPHGWEHEPIRAMAEAICKELWKPWNP